MTMLVLRLLIFLGDPSGLRQQSATLISTAVAGILKFVGMGNTHFLAEHSYFIFIITY